jgi:lipopolysaccharide export system protein LptC
MNRLKLNRWLIALIAIAMLALVFDPVEEKVRIEIDSEHPEADYTMEGVTITQYAIDGVQKHKLTAKKMIHYNKQANQNEDEENSQKRNSLHNQEKTQLDSEVSILVEPIITYKNLQNYWKLSAKQGRMTNQQSKLFLSEQVELIEQINSIDQVNLIEQANLIEAENTLKIKSAIVNSTRVTTHDLEIDLITKIAYTGQNVILQAQNITASSTGMKIDIENSKVHLLSNVQTQLIQIKK